MSLACFFDHSQRSRHDQFSKPSGRRRRIVLSFSGGTQVLAVVFHPTHAMMKDTRELTMTSGNGVGSVDGVQPTVMLDTWLALM